MSWTNEHKSLISIEYEFIQMGDALINILDYKKFIDLFKYHCD